MNSGHEMMADAKFYSGYSRWNTETNRYETWNEAVSRVMNMHRKKYADKMTPELSELFDFAQAAYSEKLVLGAQRALQFGGDQIFKHEARMYNCSVSYCDRPAFFNEAMYLMLCGVGVGFSVQTQHVAKLPQIARRSQKKAKVFQIPDSIEGWSDAFGVLLSSYFLENGTHPEYRGSQVHFDFTKIRPKGAEISGGFKAPGPDGLRNALVKCEQLLESLLEDEPITNISTIVAYDFVMHMSDAVLSGGVRRSATICIFSKTDQDMMKAKTGNWFTKNPQRGRSNNSVMLVRDQVTREEWAEIMKSVKDFGEPGFIFSESDEFLYNPCVEIGMKPQTEDGVSGFQFCNLTETNGGACKNEEIFMRAVKAAAILGTIQAGYTNFKYVSDATKKITDHEALIGVSITGWMNNSSILFDPKILQKAAGLVKTINKQVAAMLGINQAARTTCAKPSGNASVLLSTASGIHGEHSPMYFRHVQMNTEEEVAQLIQKTNPQMVEKSVWSANGTDVVIAFPIKTIANSKFKKDLLGVKQLEYVKIAQQNWVEYGTNVELCTHPKLRHNISNTISVDNWEEVEEYIFNNRDNFAGISLLAAGGDKSYVQAPFTEVFEAKQILKEYGEGSMFASGLIVEALRAYNENLWQACDTVTMNIEFDDDSATTLLKRDWVRRAIKYANNYFGGDLVRMTHCLKDCYNLHKWNNINRAMVNVDFSKQLTKKNFTDVDTLAGAACAGGSCELNF